MEDALGDILLFLMDPFDQVNLPVRDIIASFVTFIVDIFRGFFRAYVTPPVRSVMVTLQWLLTALPPTLILGLIFVIAVRVDGWRTALFSVVALVLIGAMGVWDELMITLSLIFTSVLFCIGIGLPLGIMSSRSDRFYAFIRPVLDVMQTTPPFVYLIPAVMMFGIGDVPGLIATIIFAMPPMIRLTNLGIRQVSAQFIEAGIAFGSTPRQVLWKVQIPLAIPTIMAGLNQTIMLSLSMVVIAAIIGAGGLGVEVYAGLERLNIGQAFVGGIGIVLLAMILDRLTQALGTRKPGKKAVRKK